MQILKMRDSGETHYTKKPILFDLPLKLIVIGRSQLAGKTNFLGNILLRKEYYLNDFEGENIFIVSPSTSVDRKLQAIIEHKEIPAMNILPDYDEEVLGALYELMKSDYEEAVAAKKKVPNKLVIFDDMSFGGQLKSKHHGVIAKLFCNGRHINCSTIVTAQKYSDILTTCRENTTGAVLFSSTDKQLDLISDDHNYLNSKTEFKRMFKDATKAKHSFLVVNYSNDPEQRYLDSEFQPIFKHHHHPIDVKVESTTGGGVRGRGATGAGAAGAGAAGAAGAGAAGAGAAGGGGNSCGCGG